MIYYNKQLSLLYKITELIKNKNLKYLLSIWNIWMYLHFFLQDYILLLLMQTIPRTAI